MGATLKPHFLGHKQKYYDKKRPFQRYLTWQSLNSLHSPVHRQQWRPCQDLLTPRIHLSRREREPPRAAPLLCPAKTPRISWLIRAPERFPSPGKFQLIQSGAFRCDTAIHKSRASREYRARIRDVCAAVPIYEAESQ